MAKTKGSITTSERGRELARLRWKKEREAGPKPKPDTFSKAFLSDALEGVSYPYEREDAPLISRLGWQRQLEQQSTRPAQQQPEYTQEHLDDLRESRPTADAVAWSRYGKPLSDLDTEKKAAIDREQEQWDESIKEYERGLKAQEANQTLYG